MIVQIVGFVFGWLLGDLVCYTLGLTSPWNFWAWVDRKTRRKT